MPAKPIEIDLRRDLPKVRRSLKKLLKLLPERPRDYTAPCVIGAMVSLAKREAMEDEAGGVARLIEVGFVAAPKGQARTLEALQTAYDNGTERKFLTTLKRAEDKYLGAS